MDLLLEWGKYKRAFSIKEVELSRLLNKVSEIVGTHVSLVTSADDSSFFLQIWSDKWNCFIDLKDARTVSSGDRLKVVERSALTEEVCAY